MGNGSLVLESCFSGELPIALDAQDFRKTLGQWLEYKSSKRQEYKPQGFAAMVSRAAKLAGTFGLQAVIDAMERAMANGWQGWDQQNSFQGTANGKSNHVGPGQRYAGG